MSLLNLLLISLAASPALGHYYPFNNTANDTSGDHCNELNRHRIELSKCCKYPQIHFQKLYNSECTDECIGSRDHCCSFGCIYRSTNIIDENNDISVEGLKETLKKSVYHANHWIEVIDSVVEECVEENKGRGDKNTAFCNFPWHLMEVVGCTTRKLFLQCPKMRKNSECKITKQYVEECL